MSVNRVLSAIFESLPVPTLELGKDGQVLQIPEHAPLFTALPDKTSIFGLVHKDHHPAIKAALANPEQQLPFSADVRLATVDGAQDVFVVLSIGRMEVDGEQRLFAQLTDVTSQRRRENAIAFREKRWDSALVSAGLGVWDQNFATGEMYGSDIWRQIRGIRNDSELETDFERWAQKIHPDDREHTLHCIERQNAGDPAYAVFEYRERHEDGRWVWIECRGACVERDENGKPVRIVGTDADISQRKETEHQVERISRSLKLALEASQVGVFVANFDTGITVWDDRMYEIMQIERSETIAVGGLWETRVHPDDIERVEKNVEYHVARMIPFSEEYRAIMPDGSYRYIRARSLPFIDSDGQKKMIGVNWDVTADVALRNELERAKTLAEARNRELETAKTRIEYNATHDDLTDLPNRRYLDAMFDGFARESFADGKGVGVLHVDLDRFKQINDTLGRKTGDMMLKHIAALLKKNARNADFVAHVGGDEFVVISRFSGNQRKLALMADRLIKEIRKPVHFEGHVCRLGASIGIASSYGLTSDAKQILLNADIALYNAKKRGRNRYEFFSADTQDILINTKRMSDDILLALERDEFIPFYQFRFDAQTLDIAGVETLARWQHPEKGILTPDRFLAIAEDLDVVSSIDAMMLDKAIKDFKAWDMAGLDVPNISVNVSSRRLHDPGLMKSLSNVDIPPGSVSFELLESIFLDDSDEVAISNLRQLRDMGIDIEIDDFGTGHASIVSLLKVSPSVLKVDRQLVRTAPQSSEQRKLLTSIIDIGRSLGIKVVAEGVETAAHVRVLQKLGCDYLQGYALCRPLPQQAIIPFVQSQPWRQLNLESPGPTRKRAF
ncbi:EAL domain-containing protein [Agrobacterium sp. NPDC090273]|uniref:sensor domain-containing protein n=1 Tax=Agrobacterium sp. NPDC090273 TaxID=3363919 RepID=UPI003839D442